MNKEITVRKSNFELLRIISMLMIIAYHLFIHGVVRNDYVTIESDFWIKDNVFNKIFSLFFFPGGEIGVGLFFMITGFFLYGKSKGHVSKVVIKSAFYAILSILLILLVWCIGSGNLNPPEALDNLVRFLLLPSFEGNWWFVTAYILLIFLVPTLNEFLKKKPMLVFIFVFYIYSVSLLISATNFDVIKAVLFYVMGYLFRMNNTIKKYLKKKQIILIVACMLGWTAIVLLKYLVLINYFNLKIINKLISVFISAVLVPICVWLFFGVFSSFEYRKLPFINKIAASTFGVYLIHDSRAVRYLLWNKILRIADSQLSLCYFPILIILEVSLIFGVCSFIDFLYQKTIERAVYNKFSGYLDF